MRRYHASPNIPLLAARVQCLQEAAGSPVSGPKPPAGTFSPAAHQNASTGQKNSLPIFLLSLWIAGIAVGAGLALELAGLAHQGLFAQAFGFVAAAVAVLRHPEDEAETEA